MVFSLARQRQLYDPGWPPANSGNMTDQSLPYDSLRRLCIRAPNWVGDAVMATPTLRAVREHFPSAHITVVIRGDVEPVVRGAPWFDELLPYRLGGPGAASEFLRCTRELRRGRRELGFALPNSFSSALMLRLGSVARRVGYARDCRSFLLTDAVPRPSENRRFKPTYMVDFYLGLCEKVGVTARDRRTQLFSSEADAARAGEALQRQGVQPGAELFLLHPGAGFGPSKRWPSQRFSRLAELLQREYGAQIAVIGPPHERHMAAEIIGGSRAPIADLTNCGIDLHLLKSVVARSALLVTTDSGPRHYGVALGIPTVCVIGPTHPAYSTSTRENDHLIRVDAGCAPCQRKVCRRDHRCMEDVTAEMALQACRRAMRGPRTGAHDD
jgi:heptosyltransferase-2